MNRYLVEVQIITLAYVMAASPEEAVAKVKERYGNIDEPESGMDIELKGDETSPLEPTDPQAPDIYLSPDMQTAGPTANAAFPVTKDIE